MPYITKGLRPLSGRAHDEIQGEQEQKTNSVALVRKRTIPTKRPPLVGKVSANFSGYRVSRGQRNESPRMLISVF
jgi:hypothetical protein